MLLARPDARPSGVLVPLMFRPGAWPVAYVVVRAGHLRDHAGEIGFPGGKQEAGETLEETALREAHEEVGLSEVEVLGELSPMPVVTGRFVLHPVVGRIHAPPRITSPEIAEIVAVALDRWLVGAERIPATGSLLFGDQVLVPHFALGERVLYGASAVVFYELLARLAGRHLPMDVVDARPWGDRYRDSET